MNSSEQTVYLVDDDPSVLKAISCLLRASDFHVMTFTSPGQFLAHRNMTTPGCLVLDLAMPGMNGLELQQTLAALGESKPIIFLTGRADIPASVRAMKQGAADFLTKPVEQDDLVQAVRTALAKDRAARQAHDVVAEIRARLATLTPREYEVFEHVISGKLNKQTAAEIGAAEKTVKIHRARVMDKMKVESVAELVRLADHLGIVPIPPAEERSRVDLTRTTKVR